MRRSIKKISKAKESTIKPPPPFEIPMKVTKGIKMVRNKHVEGFEEPKSADHAGATEVFEGVNLTNFSKNIVVNPTSQSQEEIVKRAALKRPVGNVRDSIENLEEKGNNYGQVLADIAERRNLKPFKSSMEGNLKKFFRKNMLASEATVTKEIQSASELKKSVMNTSVDSLTKADKDRIKQKIEERLKSQNFVLPPRPGKVTMTSQSLAKFAIRSIGKIKPRVVTFDSENSMNSDDSRDRILNNSNIVITTSKGDDKGFVLRSSSVGKREPKSKQKVVLFKKKSDS